MNHLIEIKKRKKKKEERELERLHYLTNQHLIIKMNTHDVKDYLNNHPGHNHRDKKLSECKQLIQLEKGEMAENIPCIDYVTSDIEKNDFENNYKDKPCMITGLANEWVAKEKWSTKEEFCRHHGDVLFKLTEMCPGNGMGKPLPLRQTFNEYLSYAQDNDVDSPWYCFGDDFLEDRQALLKDVQLPSLFEDDMYTLKPSFRHYFPVYRYMVVGGKRTGAKVHVDPKYTSAFNTLLSGRKRWVLFPPSTPEEVLQISKDGEAAAVWWIDILPKLRLLSQSGELSLFECIQQPGDTIWVPSGWWHAVLNIDHATIAYTQNSLPQYQLPQLWDRITSLHHEMGLSFYSALEELNSPILENLSKPTYETNSKASAKKKIIFLDVDGVCHPLIVALKDGTSDTSHCFKSECMSSLKSIISATNAELVLSSSWRMFEPSRQRLTSALIEHNITPFTEWTTVLEDSSGRAGQILRYVQEHGEEIDEWVILDDEDLIGSRQGMMIDVVRSRWIQTNPEIGLTSEDAKLAIKILTED